MTLQSSYKVKKRHSRSSKINLLSISKAERFIQTLKDKLNAKNADYINARKFASEFILINSTTP